MSSARQRSACGDDPVGARPGMKQATDRRHLSELELIGELGGSAERHRDLARALAEALVRRVHRLAALCRQKRARLGGLHARGVEHGAALLRGAAFFAFVVDHRVGRADRDRGRRRDFAQRQRQRQRIVAQDAIELFDGVDGIEGQAGHARDRPAGVDRWCRRLAGARRCCARRARSGRARCD